MTAEAQIRGWCLAARFSNPQRPPSWPASARCNGASGSVCAPDSGLLAPADDRNALATTAGGIVLAVCRCTLKPILAATPARSISLPRPATVNGAHCWTGATV